MSAFLRGEGGGLASGWERGGNQFFQLPGMILRTKCTEHWLKPCGRVDETFHLYYFGSESCSIRVR